MWAFFDSMAICKEITYQAHTCRKAPVYVYVWEYNYILSTSVTRFVLLKMSSQKPSTELQGCHSSLFSTLFFSFFFFYKPKICWECCVSIVAVYGYTSHWWCLIKVNVKCGQSGVTSSHLEKRDQMKHFVGTSVTLRLLILILVPQF